jgi:hypothetical protein
MKYLETQCQLLKSMRTLKPENSRLPALPFLMQTSRLTALVLLLIGSHLPAFAQGTAFTYQGRLNEGAVVANGTYDLTFQLFDAPTAGASQGGPVTNSNVSLNSGLFTVTVDFGPGPFAAGPPRWLEIAVRTNGAGAFGALTPRQALTAAPYAILAGNISGVVSTGSLSGTYSAAATTLPTANSLAARTIRRWSFG